MAVHSDSIEVSTRGHCDVVNVTEQLQAAVRRAGVWDGIATLFVQGSTASVSTIEFEPGAVEDIGNVLEKIAPEAGTWQHHERWGDDNTAGTPRPKAAVTEDVDDVPASRTAARASPQATSTAKRCPGAELNGASHARACLMGPSVTVPFVNGKLTLGQWQQVVLLDFDTQPRERKLVVLIIGE